MNINTRHIKLLALFFLVILLLVFIIQNAAVVELEFFFWSITARRAVMILSVFAIGFIFAWLICGYRQQREVERWRKRYFNLENYNKTRHK